MDDQSLSGWKRSCSRRDFLQRLSALPLLGAVWIFFGLNLARAESGKISKKVAHYQIRPSHGKMCMNCTHFLPSNPQMKKMMQNMPEMGEMMQEMPMGGEKGPMMKMMGRCEVVEGLVSPMGYCDFYFPVHRS